MVVRHYYFVLVNQELGWSLSAQKIAYVDKKYHYMELWDAVGSHWRRRYKKKPHSLLFISVYFFSAIIGVITSCAVFLFILTIICWIRNRPDGVYKTNENILAYCSPNRSEDPLVNKFVSKEYFC